MEKLLVTSLDSRLSFVKFHTSIKLFPIKKSINSNEDGTALSQQCFHCIGPQNHGFSFKPVTRRQTLLNLFMEASAHSTKSQNIPPIIIRVGAQNGCGPGHLLPPTQNASTKKQIRETIHPFKFFDMNNFIILWTFILPNSFNQIVM